MGSRSANYALFRPQLNKRFAPINAIRSAEGS